MNMDLILKEAEAYHSQGLYVEALSIYENILSETPDLSQDIIDSIKVKINDLKTRIEDIDRHDQDYTITPEEASVFEKTWTIEENVHEILGSASAFRELGLMDEAVREYMKLFNHEYPVNLVIPDLAETLFEIHSPSRVIDQIEKLFYTTNLEKEIQAEVNFSFGLEMEKRKHNDLAIEFFESVKESNPEFPAIDDKINSILGSSSFRSRYDYLLKFKIVTTSQMQNALALSKKTKKSVEFVLSEHMSISKQEIGKSLSLFYKCPFKEFNSEIPIPYELLTKLKKAFLLQNNWVPLSWEMSDGVVEIFIDDPKDLLKTDNISNLIKANKLNFSVGFTEDIHAIINRFYNEKNEPGPDGDEEEMDDDFDMIPEIDFEEEEDEDEATDEMDESSSQVVRIVDQILISAYRKSASDIHIEPSVITKKTGVRFRIDGVCQEILQIPIINARGMLSRLKILSGLDIAERRLPQDGKIKFKRKGVKPFELRLATLPTAGGFEDAVLRILAESGAMPLDNMGMNERNIRIMKKIISEPYGLVLVVGPTGSGKTTTLHAALGHINKPGIKIWTAEDPVEISQLGLRQVECKPKIGLDFARVMRAFLRADPDVIMIGEMRDHETASIGIEASLTGHLVFSTLHTNSAPETVTRLLDMGLNPLNFSDAFLGVLAQRLIRRLCKKCTKKYHPTQEEFDELVKDYGQDHFDATGIEYTDDLELGQTKTCEECSGTGYKGRLGVHELMEGTKEIKRMIKKEATSEELFIQSSKEGMATIKQDGISKVFQGLTDISEIRRVCVE